MSNPLPSNTKIKLIISAYQKLKTVKGYTQVAVVKKLNALGFSTRPPAFNRILNGIRVGPTTLVIFFNGIQKLVELELGLRWSEEGEWLRIEDGQTETVIVETKDQNQNFQLYEEGRLNLADKVDFFSTAQKEMIEFGITLNTFSSYFESRRPTAFKQPIQQLLEKGVQIKCFLLNPDWSGTSFYFDDRTSTIKEGLNGIEKIRASLRKLKMVREEFEAYKYKGKFEVFTYRHIPQNYFLAIDIKESKRAKMMTSNYLFGLKRADCPVIAFSRTTHPILFRRYADSLQRIIKTAKKVDWDKIKD